MYAFFLPHRFGVVLQTARGRLAHQSLDASVWGRVTGAGTNKAGEMFECASFRHSTSALVVELRLDSAHGNPPCILWCNHNLLS
jgi:hypothetical protein